jgi:hypothetical protein
MNELALAGLTSRADAETKFETRVGSLGMRKFLATNLEPDATGAWRWKINLPALTRALPGAGAQSTDAGRPLRGPD